MAFGNEMKDFIAAFQVGYSMFKSKDEKEWEKEKRQMERDRHAWGREDRDYKYKRDDIGDERYEYERRYRERRDGVNDAYRQTDYEYRMGDLEIRRNQQKLDNARLHGEGGPANVPNYDGSTWQNPNDVRKNSPSEAPDAEPTSAIPDDGPEQLGYNIAQQGVQVASANPNDWGGYGIQNSYAPAAGRNTGSEQLDRLATGTAVRPDRATQGIIQYANQGATRNKPLSGKLVGALEKVLPDLGVTAKVFSGGQVGKGQRGGRVGSTRHDHGNAADVFFYKDGRRLDWADPEDRPIFEEIVRRGKREGVTGFGAGPGYMQRGSMHIGFGAPGVWGKGGRRANAPEWLVKAYGAARGGLITALPEDDEPMLPDDSVPLPSASGVVEVVDGPLPEDDVEVASADGAIPLPTPRPDYAGTSEDAPRRSRSPEEVRRHAIYETAKTATLEGLKAAAKQSGFDVNSAIDDPQLEQARQNYLRGYGAAPEQMMRQVLDKIDPEHKMRPAERNMAAMAEVYKFYMDRGEVDKATEAAKSMVQYYNRAFQQYSALALAAGEKGDFDNATKAALAAYDAIPNGRDLSIEKLEDGTLNISVTDMDTGEVVNEQIMHPQEFGAIAMGFTPAMFMNELLAAAGEPKDNLKITTGEDAETAAKDVREAIDPYIDEVQSVSGLPEKLQLNDRERKAVADIGADLLRVGENAIDSDLAARTAASLFEFNPTTGEDGARVDWGTPFEAAKKPNSNKWIMRVGDREFEVPESTVNAVKRIRSRIEKDIKSGEAADAESRKNRKKSAGFLRKSMDGFMDALRGNPDQGAIPDDRQQMPVIQPFSLPKDEPPDPSWVPEPDKPVFVR